MNTVSRFVASDITIDNICIIHSIPRSLHSCDLRYFFSQFVETSRFLCFHYRHRRNPIDSDSEGAASGSTSGNLVDRRSRGNMAIVALESSTIPTFIQRYNNKHWINSRDEYLPQRCLIVSLSEPRATERWLSKPLEMKRYRHSAATTDLQLIVSFLELKPFLHLMPRGNVGTPTFSFQQSVRNCTMPSSLISKLGLSGNTKGNCGTRRPAGKYSSVPINYSHFEGNSRHPRSTRSEYASSGHSCGSSTDSGGLGRRSGCVGPSPDCFSLPHPPDKWRIKCDANRSATVDDDGSRGGTAVLPPPVPNTNSLSDADLTGSDILLRDHLPEHAVEGSSGTDPHHKQHQRHSRASVDPSSSASNTDPLPDAILTASGIPLFDQLPDHALEGSSGTDHHQKQHQQPPRASDDPSFEQWELAERLHDDLPNHQRNKERVYEDNIELVWEKGGPGLVWYTDAAFWRQRQQAEDGGEEADDWDVNTAIYDQPGADTADLTDAVTDECADTRHLVEMRLSDAVSRGDCNAPSVFNRRSSVKKKREGAKGRKKDRKKGDTPAPVEGVGKRLKKREGAKDRKKSDTPAPVEGVGERSKNREGAKGRKKDRKKGDTPAPVEGVGKRLLLQMGWRQGDTLGSGRSAALREPLEHEGQWNRRGFGYHGKARASSQRKPVRSSRQSPPDDDYSVHIATAFDNKDACEKEYGPHETKPLSHMKYRDSAFTQ